ncbi:MAG TPA: amino acid racemase [Bacteroidales bacterium]|nr:amino acid racemase [Bacteroidales bacterium]
MKRIYGIIGGAGVAATNRLNHLIEEYLTRNGAFRDAHHPEIISYQAVNSPSRSMFLEKKGETFIPSYVDIGKKLKSIGANILCMSCNTAHYAFDEIQKEVDLPFINMVEDTVKFIDDKYKNKRIGLIASDGCLMGKVYEFYFNKYNIKLPVVYPDVEYQKEVTRGIINIKNSNRFKDINYINRPRNIFKSVCDHLVYNGAEVIILGCTDISVDFVPLNNESVIIVDSLNILANSIINDFLIYKQQYDGK